MSKKSDDVQSNAHHDKLRQNWSMEACMMAQMDRVTRLAVRLADVPLAIMNTKWSNNSWIKIGTHGKLQQTSANLKLYNRPESDVEVLVVDDTTAEPRFAEHPLVSGEFSIRSFMDFPVLSSQNGSHGSLCLVDMQKRSFCNADIEALKDLASILANHIDSNIEAQKAIVSEKRLVAAVDALPDGLVFYDQDDRLVMCNKRYREIYAESAKFIVPGALFEDIIRGGVEQGQYPEAAGKEEEWIAERVRIHQNPGATVEQELPGDRWLRIQEGRTEDGGLIGFRFDITTQKRQERELTRLAWTDSLTGTSSRARFMELANTEFERAKRYKNSLAMLIVDIDHFKRINDQFGHAAGDLVLKDVTKRWASILRSSDLFGRLGGEEFGIILPQTGPRNAQLLAEKLRLSTLNSAVKHGETSIPVTISIGIAMIDKHVNSVDDMMLIADNALYEVKRNGRNGLFMFAA